MNFDLATLVRPNIRALKPYSSARDEYEGEASLFLDANENPYNTPYNRYPDPLQRTLKAKLAAVKGANAKNLFLGNGSDEPIDLLFRAFCEPAKDNVVAIDPTYGMYQVCADINNIAYRKVPLNNHFDIEVEPLLAACDANTKLLFLCSPNNPTGNSLNPQAMEELLNRFRGIVVVDEAYIDFAQQASFLTKLNQYPNLVVLQTLSKAWGCAALRLGLCFASEEIIALLNKIKYPYNINHLTQQTVSAQLDNPTQVTQWVAELMEQRTLLSEALAQLPQVKTIYPSDANFLLVQIEQATELYHQLVAQGIIVRNRSQVNLCNSCLRITVGTPEENKTLLEALTQLVTQL